MLGVLAVGYSPYVPSATLRSSTAMKSTFGRSGRGAGPSTEQDHDTSSEAQIQPSAVLMAAGGCRLVLVEVILMVRERWRPPMRLMIEGENLLSQSVCQLRP